MVAIWSLFVGFGPNALTIGVSMLAHIIYVREMSGLVFGMSQHVLRMSGLVLRVSGLVFLMSGILDAFSRAPFLEKWNFI